MVDLQRAQGQVEGIRHEPEVHPLRSHRATISRIRSVLRRGQGDHHLVDAVRLQHPRQVAHRAQALEAPERGLLRPEDVVAEAGQDVDPDRGAPAICCITILPMWPGPDHQHPGRPRSPRCRRQGDHPPPHQPHARRKTMISSQA